MTESDYLLTKLIEECAEVIQRATKALTFGIAEVQAGHTQDNATRLTHEFGDLQAVWEMLSEKGVVREPTIYMLAAKREKMGHYMQYSRKLGTLDPDPVSEHSGAEADRAPENADQSFA